jgi:hypothetical protein
MCRNIRKLRQPGRKPTREELELASLQFVRKISGYRTPSRVNREAFEQAVADIAASSAKLFSKLSAHKKGKRRVA